MDLLSALPEDVINEIAIYLDGKDVLESSTVCKSWYQKIGLSSECMKKITAKYTNSNHQKAFNILLTSNRKYHNIKIGFQRNQSINADLDQNIRAILKKFSETIVSLEISHDFQDICAFPRLKELQFKNLYYQYYCKNSNYFYSNGFLKKCNNIKKLSIISPEKLDDDSLNIVLNALMNMKNLKSLTVNQLKIIDNLQNHENCFKLEELNVESNNRYLQNNHFAAINFMKNHQLTLNTIKLYRINFMDLKLIFSEFPKLHTLHIEDVRHTNQVIKFPKNSTISNLIITMYMTDNNPRLAFLLLNLKKLKHLKLYDISWKTICISTNCEMLKTVEYKTLNKDVSEEQKSRIKRHPVIDFIKRPYSYVYN